MPGGNQPVCDPDDAPPVLGAAQGADSAFSVNVDASSLGLGGNLRHEVRLDGQASLAAVVQWSPVGHFFIRGGARFSYFGFDPVEKPFSYSWGIGYDDWHGKTWSVQLNHWGPIVPSDGLDFLGAELNIAYKLPKRCYRENCVAASAYANSTLEWRASTGLRVTLSRDPWFILVGAAYFVTPPQRFQFVYGLGRLDWRPFTFNVTYFNWDADPDPRKGSVAAGFNWAF